MCLDQPFTSASVNGVGALAPLRVAMLCSTGLGDALLQMVIANNLAANGYAVTFYSNFAHQLKAMVNNFTVKPFLDHDILQKKVSEYPVILYDVGAPYLKKISASDLAWMQENAIAYRMSSGQPDHTLVTQKTIEERLPLRFLHHAKRLLAFNQSVRQDSFGFTRRPLVEQITWFLEHQIGLENVTAFNGLCCPTVTKNKHKVLLHPTSSNPHKNWPVSNYLELAERLQEDGFCPVFTVAPFELEEWQQHTQGQFETPLFNDIANLADYYKDAAYFIGNDSGNAHLASCLGVPTYQIFSRWRSYPSWRAGWADNKVIRSPFPWSLSRKHWQNGLSVDSVYHGFKSWQQKTEL